VLVAHAVSLVWSDISDRRHVFRGHDAAAGRAYANDGQTVAVRGRDGRLSVLHSARDNFAIKEWLAADTEARTPNDPSLNGGVSCDAIGCIGKLDKGRLVSMVREVEAFAEDCTRAAVVVSARQAPSARCAAILIDREVWRSRGSIALRRTDDKFEQTVARSADHERPWTHAANSPASGARVSAPSGDVTPRPEALEADD
jgi:competence protein ComEC